MCSMQLCVLCGYVLKSRNRFFFFKKQEEKRQNRHRYSRRNEPKRLPIRYFTDGISVFDQAR